MNGFDENLVSSHTVSVSVVTYNSERHIGGLLDSLFEHTKGVDFHVFVVDNGSTDNTLEIIKQKQNNQITVLYNELNIGFGSGHNRVLDYIQSRYHLIINPDVTLRDDIVTKLVQYLDTNNDVGLVTPKILFPNGRLQVLPKRDPKLIYLLGRRINLPFFKKYKDYYEMLDKDADTVFDIEFCTGAFMFIRTGLLKKVGGFDKRYFMYFEDADLTREIRQYCHTQYNPNFIVYHEWERFGKTRLRFFLIQVSSMLKYMIKWNIKKGY